MQMGEEWFNNTILYGLLASNLDSEDLGTVIKYIAADQENDTDVITFDDEKMFVICHLAVMLRKMCK